jgi:hypothetical protein
LVSNISIKAGSRATFACRSPNSYPSAEITWFKNSYPMMVINDSNIVIETNVTSSMTTLNEFDTVSYLSFVVASADHLMEIRCNVKVGNIERTMHGSIILDVKCKYLQFKISSIFNLKF